MNGVMIPEVSAGSNQVGASDTCAAQVSCPCGSKASDTRRRAGGETGARARARRSRRLMPFPPASGLALFLVEAMSS